MAQLMPLPLRLLSLASVKSRLTLHFWYRLTREVPEKKPLNVCVCVCVSENITYSYDEGGQQTCPGWNFFSANPRDLSSCLWPVSPRRPTSISDTSASVPALSRSPVYTSTTYVYTKET